jgi:predicted metal-dependent peptidase
MTKNIHPRIEQAIISLLSPYQLHFFYYMLCRIDMYESTRIPTMAATVKSMRLAILYNPSFVDELDDHELVFLMLHELFHHLHHHLTRGVHYHPEKANIAMDGIINYLIETHYTKMRNGYQISKMPVFTKEKIEQMITKIKEKRDLDPKAEKEIRDMEGKATGCKLDENYLKTGSPLAFEPYYEWLMEQHEKSKNGEKNDLSVESKMMLDNADMKDMMMDVHIKLTEVDEDVKKQLVEDAVAKARLEATNNRGTMAGDVEEVLGLLLKAPRKNNMKLIQRCISALKGKTKEKSWKRLNRRVLGIKGKVGMSNAVNVILDVSGSMWGRFDKVISEIYRDNFDIHLIQADTQVQKVERITDKNQLKRFAMKGGGGTVLSPAVDYVLDPKNGLSKHPTVLLSDGYTDTIDFHNTRNQFLIITTDELVPYINAGPKIRQVKIEN